MDIEHELDQAYKTSLIVFQDEIKAKTGKKLDLEDIQMIAQMAALLTTMREKYDIGKCRDRYDDFIPANDLVLDILFKDDYYQDYDASKWHSVVSDHNSAERKTPTQKPKRTKRRK